jgi:hypothetical protein
LRPRSASFDARSRRVLQLISAVAVTAARNGGFNAPPPGQVNDLNPPPIAAPASHP